MAGTAHLYAELSQLRAQLATSEAKVARYEATLKEIGWHIPCMGKDNYDYLRMRARQALQETAPDE